MPMSKARASIVRNRMGWEYTNPIVFTSIALRIVQVAEWNAIE